MLISPPPPIHAHSHPAQRPSSSCSSRPRPSIIHALIHAFLLSSSTICHLVASLLHPPHHPIRSSSLLYSPSPSSSFRTPPSVFTWSSMSCLIHFLGPSSLIIGHPGSRKGLNKDKLRKIERRENGKAESRNEVKGRTGGKGGADMSKK